jgi:dihydrofolate reductase
LLRQSCLVSANGVFSEPLAWAGPFFGAGSAAQSLADLQRSRGMLMGRTTYEIFSAQWPYASGEYADYVNAMPRYVFSSTLRRADWTNTTVVAGDVAAAVADLKRTGATDDHAAADLIVYGHGQFGQTLCDAGLVDELRLIIVPVFVAAGSPFFRPGGRVRTWDLVSAGPGADDGLAALIYRPAGESS